MADDVRDKVAEHILEHWPTPTSGCSCGQVRLGQSWPLHLADELLPLMTEAERAQVRADVVEEIAQAIESHPTWGSIFLATLARDHAKAADGWSTLHPEPSPGTVVRDASGKWWLRFPEGYWIKEGSDEPESWTRVNEFGPVEVVNPRPTP
jgi:hypothetical protein